MQVVLRNSIELEDPLSIVLGFLDAYGLDVRDVSSPTSFREADLRSANRGGARISAAQIAAILERRRAIERALRSTPWDASLAGTAEGVPWLAMSQLFDAFADIPGVGLAKTTKALHPKRPALIPILDSVVQRYLEHDDPGSNAPFGERALALVRGYRRDLDRNRTAVRAIQRELVRRHYEITEVRVLDLLIWSVGTVP